MAYRYTDALKEKVGKAIKKARKEKGLTQVEVSADTGIGLSHYVRIETGKVNPSLEKLYSITKALQIKSKDILPF